MKRSRTSVNHRRTGDIRKDLTQEQLAGIGSIALAYNEVEMTINALVGLSCGILTKVANEVTSRINGIDGKIEIIKAGLREYILGEEFFSMIGEAFGENGFKSYKKYRDAVIHARILDAPLAIALSPPKRGKTEEVLLSVDALDGLYNRLVILRLELNEICMIAICLFSDRHLMSVMRAVRAGFPAPEHISDLPRRQFAQEIQENLSRCQAHQKRRLSLPPLPEFPEEPPFPSGLEDYGALPESAGG
jgi:hypothetical protein